MVKNLIIKSSKSMLPDNTLKSNYGDVLRSTVLISCMGKDYLWLTDHRSLEMLEWFVDKEKIIIFEDCIDGYDFPSEMNIYNLDNYVFDTNIYKGLKGKWHGFVWDEKNSVFAENELISVTESYKEKDSSLSWQQALVEGMGFEWSMQDYAECRIQNDVTIDVGLNWNVHPDWPSKQWPKENWKKLEHILQKKCSVSWQQGINNFGEYVKWLNSCNVIVTCETLGLHLASALRKKVVAIVGAVENSECPYDRIELIKPSQRDCMPCNLSECKESKHCLSEIEAETVSEFVLKLNNKDR